ncbi:hypothetical protein Bca52824_063721 [Brassica carinata]|uniref:Uncharacterized protein n=1 Tax=Brassica carinata TaxID=52824 RepID=A0A8X7UAL2_BRACI|nr:hypothetical protein Bca52824_063721 [Brassica carinata]
MSEARRGSQSHHQRKPWLLLLEINERSPTKFLGLAFRLGPLEQDGSSKTSSRRRRQRKAEEAEIYQDDAALPASIRQSRPLSSEILGTHPDADLVTGSGRNPRKLEKEEQRGGRAVPIYICYGNNDVVVSTEFYREDEKKDERVGRIDWTEFVWEVEALPPTLELSNSEKDGENVEVEDVTIHM